MNLSFDELLDELNAHCDYDIYNSENSILSCFCSWIGIIKRCNDVENIIFTFSDFIFCPTSSSSFRVEGKYVTYTLNFAGKYWYAEYENDEDDYDE